MLRLKPIIPAINRTAAVVLHLIKRREGSAISGPFVLLGAITDISLELLCCSMETRHAPRTSDLAVHLTFNGSAPSAAPKDGEHKWVDTKLFRHGVA